MPLQLQNNNNESTSLLKSVDWLTILFYIILVVAGAVSIYAATYNFDKASMFDFSGFSGKQFLWAGLSLVLGLSLLLIDRRIYEAYAYPIYGAMIILLIVTAFIAPDIKGSRSWLTFGSVSLQPAEFAKTATALALAKLFSTYGFALNNWKNYAIAAGIIILPILCIILENETGSALVFTSLIFVLYREGMSGFVLFAALCAITYFVVVLKYAALTMMGIPLGTAVAFIIIMVLTVGMLLFYCRSFFITRNVVLTYLAGGILAGVLAYFGITINGYVFFGVLVGGTVIYLLISTLHDDVRRLLMTVGFIVASVVFIFTVDIAFNKILKDHQQKRITVVLGIADDPRGIGYNVNQSKIAIGSGGLLGRGFRAAHRLHLLHHRRRGGFRRFHGRAADFPRPDSARNHHRRAAAHRLRARIRLLRGVLPHLPPHHQHRHGARSRSRDRHSVALLQLRRLFAVGIHLPAVHPAPHRRRQRTLRRVVTGKQTHIPTQVQILPLARLRSAI